MELLVYKASAGSGKTFTLAVEYIKHLIINPRAYRQILAVTFTNKATAEMKERILQQLFGIWKGDPSSDAYLARIREELKSKNYSLMNKEGEDAGEDEVQELRRRAGMALQYMLHDYSRFRVETIDSFFQSVMRNLARELELSPNLNIELNNTEVLSDAVDSLIEKLTPTSPVLAWLLEYIDERIRDDKRWNVSNEVKSFGRNIFDESYIERGEVLRQCLRTPGTLKLYRDVLREMETDALEQMKGFYDQFEGELDGHALAPEDLKGGSRGIGNYFRKLRDGKLTDKDVMTATLQNCLADAKNWATKTSARKDEIIRLAETSLMPLLQDAERLRPQKNNTVNSCRLSLQHLNKLQLLNHIDEEVRTLNREHNRFLLSDTNALLHNLVREGDSSFVFEKIGANIRNVMIDEFQDTSRMQWDNFRLLLLEGLSQGADSLIVGDVKQSIYRWRNGDWGILNELGKKEDNEELRMKNEESDNEESDNEELRMKNEELPCGVTAQPNSSFFIPHSSFNSFPLRIETLKVNRRSETNIISFNNRVFTAAVDYLNTLHLNELKEDCIPLKQAYADVAQESPKSEARGYVKASFLEPDEEHNYTEQTLLAMGEEVQNLLQAGVALNDITILVRKNKNIPPIADYFDKELHLPVVSDEAFRLDASLAICMLMDALRYLSNPEDKIARASLIANYQLQATTEPLAKGKEALTENEEPLAKTGDAPKQPEPHPDWNRMMTGRPEEMLPETFTSRLDTLRLMPLYELLEELFSIFGMNRIEKQDAYLFSFFDAVTEYLQSNSSELDGFIRYWDETLGSKTIPSGEMDGMRILSIHKSKGLEFHTVLIPFCDWKLENETNNQLVWCTAPEKPYNAINLVPVNYSATMAESVYRQDYLHERLQLWVDNLNLLYVAFTRAGKNLILWSKKGQKGTISELLGDTLPRIARDGEGSWDEEAAVYESGELCPSAPTVQASVSAEQTSASAEQTSTSAAQTSASAAQTSASAAQASVRPVQKHPRPTPTVINKLAQKPAKLPVHMESMLHDIEFRQSNRSADFIAGLDESESSHRFINRGRLLHTLFSAIETEADIDDAITRLVFEGIIGRTETEEEVRQLTERAFSLPQVKDWYSGSWELFNECDIIWQENGELHTRRPDRVMMRDGEIVVVDFKFGKPNKKYNKQVQGYMQLLVRMGYNAGHIKGYLWYVEEETVEQV